MAKPDMSQMLGALGGMPKAGDEPPPAPDAGPTGTSDGEVSDEEMTFAKDMGFDEGKARALKRFVKSCMQADADGDYEGSAAEENAESAAEQANEKGAM